MFEKLSGDDAIEQIRSNRFSHRGTVLNVGLSDRVPIAVRRQQAAISGIHVDPYEGATDGRQRRVEVSPRLDAVFGVRRSHASQMQHVTLPAVIRQPRDPVDQFPQPDPLRREWSATLDRRRRWLGRVFAHRLTIRRIG